MLIIKRVPCSPVCKMCGCGNENDLHLFVQCELARRCWSNVRGVMIEGFNSFIGWVDNNFNRLYERACCNLVMISWKLWETHNEKIWNNRIISRETIVEEVIHFLTNWVNLNHDSRSATVVRESQVDKWTTPPSAWLKMNVDATINTEHHRMGFGSIIRDSQGNFVAAK